MPIVKGCGRLAFAAVENRALVSRQDIVHERGVGRPDGITGPSLYSAELETAGGDFGAKRPGAVPGETDGSRDDDQEREPQPDRPAGLGGTMGGFGDGHCLAPMA